MSGVKENGIRNKENGMRNKENGIQSNEAIKGMTDVKRRGLVLLACSLS